MQSARANNCHEHRALAATMFLASLVSLAACGGGHDAPPVARIELSG